MYLVLAHCESELHLYRLAMANVARMQGNNKLGVLYEGECNLAQQTNMKDTV
jgi:hypothetical protein